MTAKNKKIFLADKISGLEGNAFSMSVLPPVIVAGNRRLRYKFPFWAVSVPPGSEHATEWIDNEGYNKETERILRAVVTGQGLDYFKGIKTKIVAEEKAFEKESRALLLKLEQLDDKDLIAHFDTYIKEYASFYGLGIVTFLYEAILSEKLMRSLARRYQRAAAFLPQLLKSSYQSFMLASENALLEIKACKNKTRRKGLVDGYCRDYFYIRTNYLQAPAVTAAYVRERLKHLTRSSDRPATGNMIKLLDWEKKVIRLLRINEALRDKRKQICLIGTYLMFRFLEEAARRQKIDPKLAGRAFWFEYGDLVDKGARLVPILKKRREFSVIYRAGRCLYLDYAALREKPRERSASGELVGTPASGGFFRGTARIIFQTKDFASFRKGEILVAQMTRPEFLPVMKKAAAIITDEGGLTCHAAIVAREMGIPCIVGVKDATKILASGALIEVDADNGTIKRIKQSSRIKR